MSWLPTPGWGERLEAAVIKSGGTKAVSDGSSVPESTIKRYFKADNEPGAYKLAAIARFCGISVEQILYGEQVRPDMSAQIERPTYLGESDLADDEEALSEVVFIPRLAVVASAGPGIENPFPETIGHLPFPKAWLYELGVPETFARLLELGGDSMEPTIRDGSICLLDTRSQVPRVEGVYALIDGRDVRIKRIGRGWEGKIVLISDNERYESETLAAPDAEALRIAGKIVWAGGKI
ncbi:MAG: helix-turn-helix transcriptional regulator [Bosea sp.]|uniref:LexA family transcriptional regulator n=1 Tax=Bosea sp. (in: a-proteobacteria) TaxID=1871050 RepID=UPI001AD3A99B|nr:XRE family transcriptional regulator [Bosea sp. (in: a-proteobacteria)]MBN9471708.1 helix-turn-helix transcriptional regulator [Bosea sp. (in: a-proteobacteria)]